MDSAQITAAAAGTWTLGDLTVNRMGFGAMRLAQTGRALTTDSVPSDRDRAIAVLAVARARGATAAQVRLAWTLQRGPHVLAIPGTGDPAHLAENVAAGALRLSPDEMARLGALRW